MPHESHPQSSKARKRFSENRKDVERLLEIHADVAGDGPGRKHGVEVLNKSAVVLICAIWEAYVEDLLSEALTHLTDKILDTNKLPKDLLNHIAKDIKQDRHDLSPWKLAGDGWKKVLKDNLQVSINRHVGKWNTPKAAQITELYNQGMGIPDITSSWKRPRLAADKARKQLDNYVVLRGAIAHGATSSERVTKAIAQKFLNHVDELIGFMDGTVNQHVRSICNVGMY
ncbi:MAG: HEPN domain-containing protein [Rhodospirillales bacterium]|nr:HEPN domain-containing protein [Rhodospirillales bacterium]